VARILVVDDDPSVRLLLRTLLPYAGHSVLEASDGVEGLSTAAREYPDLILLDLSMPSMSGPAFLRALRADERTRSTNVALHTATSMNAALIDFMEMYGIRHVVPKAAEPTELLHAVASALGDEARSRMP
jgi:sigma-B regulation protein RsbU (phosphoserine phosphatase)